MFHSRFSHLRIFLLLIILKFIISHTFAQEVADDSFHLPVIIPTFKSNLGPVLLIDEAHNNGGLLEENYRPFKKILERDGYRIVPISSAFTAEVLSKGQILVIINALALENLNKWSLPVSPAFSHKEILAVCTWVYNGGALLLVADHMPFPGAAQALAHEFGVTFTNGFAIDTVHWDALVFRKSDGSLAVHPITEGRNPSEKIDSVATFWGQAFQAFDQKVKSLFIFREHVVTYNPDTAWRFNEHTRVIPVKGWMQASTLAYGKGRVLILGEAGLLSAQIVGPRRVRMGMNSRLAEQNPQFILNAMHWLSGLLPVQ